MKYSKDFKEEALKLSDEVGVKKAAALVIFSTIQILTSPNSIHKFSPSSTKTVLEGLCCICIKLHLESIKYKISKIVLQLSISCIVFAYSFHNIIQLKAMFYGKHAKRKTAYKP